MLNAISQFQFSSTDIGGYEHIKNIHDDGELFIITTENGMERYILKKLDLNKYSKDPVENVRNLANVLCYIRAMVVMFGGDPNREGMGIVPTKEGLYYYKDKRNNMWMAFPCIDNSFTVEKEQGDLYKSIEMNAFTIESERKVCKQYDIIYRSGIAYGRFLKHMDKFPIKMLHITEDSINSIGSKYEELERMAEEIGESSSIGYEIGFVKKYKYLLNIIDKLKTRVIHNSARAENVFFDNETGEALGVMGLDRVTSGPGIYDFGDFICNSATCDSNKYLRDDLYEAFTKGYLLSSGMLTDSEIKYLPQICMVAAYYRVICYLNDYVLSLGEAALDKARNGIKLLSDMDYKLLWMQATVKKWCR